MYARGGSTPPTRTYGESPENVGTPTLRGFLIYAGYRVIGTKRGVLGTRRGVLDFGFWSVWSRLTWVWDSSRSAPVPYPGPPSSPLSSPDGLAVPVAFRRPILIGDAGPGEPLLMRHGHSRARRVCSPGQAAAVEEHALERRADAALQPVRGARHRRPGTSPPPPSIAMIRRRSWPMYAPSAITV